MINKLPLIEKIHLLESKLGHNWKHTNLEPFQFNSRDVVQVQNAGKRIQQHLGLPPLTFIVSYARQKENVGGHIQLDNEKDVFIEIDERFRHDSDIVLSILAHEICHKYLQINGIQLFPTLENEILTDTATVYTGLGKLSLNGCEKNRVTIQGDRKIHQQEKVGYLNREQFAFLYLLICSMRQVPQGEIIGGLNTEAVNVVRQIQRTDKEYFSQQIGENKYAENTALQLTNPGKKDLAKLEKHIRIIREGLMPQANSLLNNLHAYQANEIQPLLAAIQQVHERSSYNYIENLKALEQLKAHEATIRQQERQAQRLSGSLTKFIDHLQRTHLKKMPISDHSYLQKFACPSCGKKMQISKKKLAKITCPNCQYRFMVDTGGVETSTSDQQTSTRKGKAGRPSLWERFKAIFS